MTTHPRLIGKLPNLGDDSCVLYDAPGIEDTRGFAHEITSAYSMRRIMQTAKNNKLILIVEIGSISHSRSKPIRDLVTSIIKLFGVTFKLECLSLIVTKATTDEYSNENNVMNGLNDCI